ASSSATIGVEDLAGYKFVHPKDWESQVYQRTIAPKPERRVVLDALGILFQVGLPAYYDLVVDLACRLWRTGIPIIKRRRIERAIRRDLRAWMSESEGRVICPSAYLAGKGDLKSSLIELEESV